MLETERLLLRQVRLADAQDFAALFDDPVAMRFVGGVVDVRAEEVIDRWLARWEANGIGPFALERREDGRVVGRAGIVVWDTRMWRNSTFAEAGEHAQPELGWALARAYWGNGYATEAARAIRDWALRDVGIERLISLIQPANVASVRVAERLGAQPTETVTLESGERCVVWLHAPAVTFS